MLHLSIIIHQRTVFIRLKSAGFTMGQSENSISLVLTQE